MSSNTPAVRPSNTKSLARFTGSAKMRSVGTAGLAGGAVGWAAPSARSRRRWSELRDMGAPGGGQGRTFEAARIVASERGTRNEEGRTGKGVHFFLVPRSSVFSHPHLPAVLEHGARGALRKLPGADVLS